MARFIRNLKELYRYRVLIQNLVVRELKARYRGTVLGFFWSFFNPLLLMIVYTAVFGLIINPRDPAFESSPFIYALYLFCGILPWHWFASSTLESANVLMINGNLLKKILFPAEVLPVVTVTSNMIHFFFGLPILFLFILVMGRPITPYALFLPVVVFVQYVFTLGFSLIISSLTVHFRDIKDILSNLLTFWFFASPIIYAMSFPSIQKSSALRLMLNLNPMTHIIQGYQYSLYYGSLLPWKRLGVTFIVSLVLFVIGYMIFDRLRDSFPEEVSVHPIEVDHVSRMYQKYSARHRFQTFKSALVKGDLFGSLRPDELVTALDDVTLSVEKGQTFGVIGENGSGKSTLLKLIAGIAKPTRGEVRTQGKISALIELGAGFHPEITGRENVFINGIMLGLTKKEISAKFDEIVAFAELEEFIDAPVKTYSSGMYMRLGFAIAINVNPEILLIDEVLAVGDAAFVPKCLDRIDDFRRRQKTILFVSHDLNTVGKICDRVAWLKNGRVQQIGDPVRIVDAYLQDVAEKQERGFEQRQKGPAATPDGQDERRENRWGKREIEITRVVLKNSRGEEKHVFAPEDGLLIEMDIVAHAPADDFVFGIGIFNSQGICCYGTNTYIEDYEPVSLRGEAKVACRIESLSLVNGTYYLDVAVHKRDGYPYDYHRNLYSFLISSTHKDVGIGRLSHGWSFSPEVGIKPPQG